MNQKQRAIIIDVAPPGTSNDQCTIRLQELITLVTTLENIEIVYTTQKKTPTAYKTFLGKGKLEEMVTLCNEMSADILIIGNSIKPRQIYTINESLRKIKAVCRDRVDLILKIFAQHAVSTESKLQIELAAIKHIGPRIVGMGMELSRQGGGIGTSGIGETNTEIMRRHLQSKREAIVRKLKEYTKMRKLHRDGRKRKGLKTVGIVGYTNAGKSTLLTALTNKEAYVEDKLFATLGTQVGSFFRYPPGHYGKPYEILVSDTIGFIRDLPPKLIQSFRSTLEDSIQSDLILHVIDVSDPLYQEKISIVENILEEIEATQPRIYICNKNDKLTIGEQQEVQTYMRDYNHVFISALKKTGIETLKEIIRKSLYTK